LTVEVTGLVLGISVSRSITKGLNEINRSAKRISQGDLSARAAVLSNDEIGQVANAMNEMTERLVMSNKDLEQFAFIASHDLQEPLRTISNYVGLIQKKYKSQLDEDADKYLGILLGAAIRMQSLIKDLLDYSRIGQVRILESIDCNTVMHQVIEDLDASIKETNTEIIVEKLPVIFGYPEIKSLFQNLVVNAIKFRKKNEDPVIRISAVDKGKVWIFSINDNGIGIEDLYHEKIFTIFQKLHAVKEYAGTGIGLAHCKKIVELHGGDIWVDSEAGKGSTFYFSIQKKIFHEKELPKMANA
jgi:light-regulated signal transduction histidine kinase (bacteriophytochrome)